MRNPVLQHATYSRVFVNDIDAKVREVADRLVVSFSQLGILQQCVQVSLRHSWEGQKLYQQVKNFLVAVKDQLNLTS